LNVKRLGADNGDEYNKITKEIDKVQKRMSDNMWLISATRKKDIPTVSDKLLHSSVARKLNQQEMAQISTLDEFEIVTNRRGFEHAMVIDKHGDVKVLKSGQRGSVSFGFNELVHFKGGRLSHNHPNASPFSMADIKMFTNYDMKELRAVSDDVVYVIKQDKPFDTVRKRQFITPKNDASRSMRNET